MPILKFKDPIYRNTIYFIFDEPNSKIAGFVKKKADHDVKLNFENYCAYLVAATINTFLLIVQDTKNDFNQTLLHECFHLTAQVMRACGVELTRESEEAYAYYMEWVFNECLTRRNKFIEKQQQVGATSI